MHFKLSPILVSVVLILAGFFFVIFSNALSAHIADVIVSRTPLDVSIAKLETSLTEKPFATKPYVNLAALYLQKIRETSDSSYYAKIETLMNKALNIDPTDADIYAIQSSVAMGRHDFKSGYDYIQKALSLNKTKPVYYGLEGDADIELGKYTEAVSSFQSMINLRPDFNSWSRIAYIRELYRDVSGAQYALHQAIDSGSNYKENIAWAYVELGKLELRHDIPSAKSDFESALTLLPTYSQAHEGLGKAAYFSGDTRDAEKQFLIAYTTLPLAQYAVNLGDLYALQHESTTSNQYYALAQNAYATSIKSGVNTDLEESLFLNDHDLNAANALAMARRAYKDRPSIYGADYLSWALYKNGDYAGAAALTPDAMRLGPNDALILFHQGMIALHNNDREIARKYLQDAYDLNPHFSLQYAQILKDTVSQL